jgi:hypothetical protein
MAKKEKIEQPLTAEEVKRNAALTALIQSDTLSAAAETAGISRKTLYNYLNTDKDFGRAYRDIKQAQLRETAVKVQSAADKAIDLITGLLDDEDAPYPVRLNAALKTLDLIGTYRKADDALDSALLTPGLAIYLGDDDD